jgi:hypothetical protein
LARGINAASVVEAMTFIRMKALSLACSVGRTLSIIEGSSVGGGAFSLTPLAFCRYPLATGPEGVTLEGRKMAMA